MNPAAGLAAISSAYSLCAWVETRITVPLSRRARSKPLSSPSRMSTSTTSGRTSSSSRSASALVVATPTTATPSRSSSRRAASRKGWLSSTMRQRICTRSASLRGASASGVSWDGACCCGGKACLVKVDELGCGGGYVFLLAVEGGVARAFNPVDLLRLSRPLVAVDAHPGRDGLAADDDEQRSRRDQVRALERIEERHAVDARPGETLRRARVLGARG